MASKKKAAEPSAAPKKNLLSLIQGLEKDKGIRHVELRSRDADYLSTGCLTLDLIMGGGYFGGRILQIYGPPGAGKSSISYMSAGQLHKRGVMTLFFDHEGTTDAKYIKTLGMDMSNTDPLVRYYRPNDGVQTYEMMLNVMQGLDDNDGGLPQVCFFIDSIATMPTRGEMEDWESNKRMAQRASMHSEWMGRLRTLVSKKNVSVIAVNQIRANPSPYAPPESRPGGNAWEFATDNLLKIKKGKPVEVEGEVYQPMKFKTEKNKNFISHQEAEVHLNLGRGIDPASDVIQFLKLTGCLTKVGKKLLVTGLGGDFDGLEFAGAAALERELRKERQEVLANPKLLEESVYHACAKMLLSGDAIKRYMAEKKTTTSEATEEDEDAATKKASSVMASDEEAASETEDDASEEEAPKLGKKKK
jgi:RecA/RadA recombinase